MISLIISIYKRLDFLDILLQGVARQSYRNFEVIVAEDDNAEETIRFLKDAQSRYEFPIRHVSQEDNGFRKTKILNAALNISKGEQIVFFDGDCIPHKHCLKEYAKAIDKNKLCYGRRACLSEAYTARLLEEKKIKNLNFLKALFAASDSMKHGFYLPFELGFSKQHREILGCNWGVLREHIFAVNGFDEDYTHACIGEDIDIGKRLKSSGLRMKSMKNRAIVYHLYHPATHPESDNNEMTILLTAKMQEGSIACRNGLYKRE
ncbi:MAG: glycosyltransferase [Prevotellaceae bacterium]|jgi:cellulose synthase/poly-beta-1,6-N-acetylglucosamine synthase-like glycosyltransferase|nr:glycosyltransferase [Prevotellaceae bacterium]